jgi:hypothetical protein
MTLRLGSLFWAVILEDPKKEPRPCVATCVPTASHHVVEVVYGQDHPPVGCPRPGEPGAPLLVRRGSDLGKALKLTKDTHFCSRALVYVATISPKDLRVGDCPDLDLLDLESIAQEQR